MKRAAQFVRIITVPSFLFFVLILITYFFDDFYTTTADIWIPVVFIGCFPALGYLIALIIRKIKHQNKEQGRKLQRLLAFVFSMTGYTISFTLTFILNITAEIREMISTYFITAAFLSIFNLFHIKASGHGAGIIGPMLLLCHYLGWIYIIPCIIVYASSLWASIYLKRHTVLQFILGTICSALGFIISILIF